MGKPSFVYVTYIKTTPEKLWEALTDSRLSQEYWGGRQVESDWQPGSPIQFRKASGEYDVVRAKVIEVSPPRYLAMSWTYELSPGAEPQPASRVTYTIQAAGTEDVKLTLVHEEFEPGSVVDDGLRQGWPAILSSLKSYLERGEALEMTKRWAAEGK